VVTSSNVDVEMTNTLIDGFVIRNGIADSFPAGIIRPAN